jgi:hypothetical protein
MSWWDKTVHLNLQEPKVVNALLYFQAACHLWKIIIDLKNSSHVRDLLSIFQSVGFRALLYTAAKIVAEKVQKSNKIKEAVYSLPTAKEFNLVKNAIGSLQTAIRTNPYNHFTTFIPGIANIHKVREILFHICKSQPQERHEADIAAACLLRPKLSIQSGIPGIEFNALSKWYMETIRIISARLNVTYEFAFVLTGVSFILAILYLACGKKPRNVLTRISGPGGKFAAEALQKIHRSIRGGNVTNTNNAGNQAPPVPTNMRGIRGGNSPTFINVTNTNNARKQKQVPPVPTTMRVTRSRAKETTK